MLLKFNEEWARSSVNGALAIRKDINRIVDEICAQGYRNICWLGIGGTWASGMQAAVHMKEQSEIETWAENASEYNTTGNKRVGEGTVVITSSVTGSTVEVVEAVKRMDRNLQKNTGMIQSTILWGQETSGAQRIPMQCAIGRNSCGSRRSPSHPGSSFMVCLKSSQRKHRLPCS